jgi:hypothetical protein
MCVGAGHNRKESGRLYIRWITRKHKNRYAAHMIFHDAYLVESYRDVSGASRQKTFAYLGNIRQIGDNFPHIERELFFLQVRQKLSELAGISDEECRGILQQLYQRVAPLTYHEVILAFQQNLHWFFHWYAIHNMHPPTAAEIHRMISVLGQEKDK